MCVSESGWVPLPLKEKEEINPERKISGKYIAPDKSVPTFLSPTHGRKEREQLCVHRKEDDKEKIG